MCVDQVADDDRSIQVPNVRHRKGVHPREDSSMSRETEDESDGSTSAN